jgi:hypothetical protein
MLNLVAVLNKDRFCPRWYIAAATDNMSLARAKVAEESGMGQVLSSGLMKPLIKRFARIVCPYMTCTDTELNGFTLFFFFAKGCVLTSHIWLC